MEAKKAYQPNVIVPDTNAITEQQWLSIRRRGIGGSDAAAVLGISPFKTRKELFWEKAGVPCQPVDDDDSWLAKEAGHRLEGLVAQLFAKKNPGWAIYDDTRMFQHPQYPWMLADIDRIAVNKKTGQAFILEIKTCDEHVLDKWGDKNSNVIPPEYEIQGRHYMAVLGVNGVIYACLGGTRMYGYRQRFLARDLKREQGLIRAEADFWKNYVMQEKEPPYNGYENASMVLSALNQHYRKKNATKRIPGELACNVGDVLQVDQEISRLKEKISALETTKKKKLAPVAEYLKGADGTCKIGDSDATVRYIERNSKRVKSDDLQGLKLEYPDAYDEFVSETKSGFWRTTVKEKES